LAPGVLLDYRLQLLGIKFRWKTLIETFEPPHRFSDLQLNGPYKLWHHAHEFYAVDGGTLVIDRVRYQVPLGLLGRIINILFVRRQLEAIFDYRQAQIAARFSAPIPVSAASVS
ncbi:MAG TPA: SRPBCC family protein, partial [Pirellulales bacterium]